MPCAAVARSSALRTEPVTSFVRICTSAVRITDRFATSGAVGVVVAPPFEPPALVADGAPWLVPESAPALEPAASFAGAGTDPPACEPEDVLEPPLEPQPVSTTPPSASPNTTAVQVRERLTGAALTSWAWSQRP